MKIFSKLYVSFQRKLENKSYNLAYCSSLEPVLLYNFSKIESTIPVAFWDYVDDSSWLRGMVYTCLIRKVKYDWFLHEGLLLDWLIFLLYLLQSVCFSKYSAKTTNFSTLNLFFHSLHPFVLKHFRIFVNVMRSTCPRVELTREFCNFFDVTFCLHGLVCWRLTVSK